MTTFDEFLCASETVLSCFREAGGYANEVQHACSRLQLQRIEGDSTYPALYSLSADLINMHCAVLELCRSGYASPCVPVLRTMLDIVLNLSVVTHSKALANVLAFRYLWFCEKAAAPGEKPSKALRAAISALPPEDRRPTEEFFFQGKRRGYWYAPEFAKPEGVLETLADAETKKIYELLSGGAHGGRLGLGVFRDTPDLAPPGPRRDSQSQTLVLGLSTKLVLEGFNRRDRFENEARLGSQYRSILTRLSSSSRLVN